jgi:hypothetical protein
MQSGEHSMHWELGRRNERKEGRQGCFWRRASNSLLPPRTFFLVLLQDNRVLNSYVMML